jgi:hypothetical protein
MKSEILKRTKRTFSLLNLSFNLKKIQSSIFSFQAFFTKFSTGFEIKNLTIVKVNSSSTGSTQFNSDYLKKDAGNRITKLHLRGCS